MHNFWRNKLARLGQDKEILLTISRTFFVRGVAAFGTLLLNLVLARLLGAQGLGLFMLAFTLLVGISTLARFGTDNALLRFAGAAWGTGNVALFAGVCRQAALVVTALSITLSLILYYSAGWLADTLFNQPGLAPLLQVTAWTLMPYSAMYVFSTLLKSARWAAIAPLFENGGVSLGAAVLVLGAYWLWDVVDVEVAIWALLLTAVVFAVTSALLVWARTAQPLKAASAGGLQPGFYRVAGTFTATAMATFVIQWSASLVLGGYASAADVGLFNAAQRTAFIITFILMVFNGVLPPRIATLHAKGDIAELERMVVRATSYMTLVALPLVVLFVCLPGAVLGLFGEEFISAAPHLVVLSLAQLVNVATGSVGFLLNMTGNEKIMRNLVFCIGGGGLLMAFVLVPLLGIWGATISAATAIVGQNLLAAWYVYKRLNILTVPLLSYFLGK